MAIAWQQVEQSEAYRKLPVQEQGMAKEQYFKDVVSLKPEFQSLAPQEQEAASNQFLGTLKEPVSKPPVNKAEDFIGQSAKGFVDTMHKIPGVRQFMDLNPEIKELSDETGKPKTMAGKVGEFAGQAAGYAPAFEAGTAAAGGRLIGGALGVGAQEAASDIQEGKGPKATLQDAAMTTAGTYVGGKILQGAAHVISEIPNAFRGVAGRIHDYIARLPTKAFSYGKDPLKVMAEEKITANTIGDYAKEATERLSQRTKELNDAVKSNYERVNLDSQVNGRIDAAIHEAKTSYKDKTDLVENLEHMRDRINAEHDLSDMSLQEAVSMKRKLADDFPFSPMEAKSSTNNLMAKAGHQIHHDINAVIDDVAPHVGELNEKVSSLIDISKAAENRLAVEARNNPLGLIGTIIGTGVAGGVAGQMTGHNPIEAGLGTALAVKAISSPAVLTRVANTLSHLSEVDKINLFKVAPWFMDVAAKAQEYMKNTGRAFGMAGQAGKNAVPTVEAELVAPRQLEHQPFGGPQPRTGSKYPVDDPTIDSNGLPLTHPVIPMGGTVPKGLPAPVNQPYDPHGIFKSRTGESISSRVIPMKGHPDAQTKLLNYDGQRAEKIQHLESKYEGVHNKAQSIKLPIEMAKIPTQAEINLVNSTPKSAADRNDITRILKKYNVPSLKEFNAINENLPKGNQSKKLNNKGQVDSKTLGAAALVGGSALVANKANANTFDKFEGGKQINRQGKLISNGGIERPSLNEYNKAHNTSLKLEDLTKEDIKKFRNWYFRGQNYEKLGNKAQQVIQDYAYHFGKNRANKDLQRIAGARIDGKIGHGTISKANIMDDKVLANRLLDEQISYMKTKNNYAQNARGWHNRINMLRGQINNGGKK